MFFDQLSDSDGFSAWRDMWNDYVLPYLRSLRPVSGPGIRIDRKGNASVIRAVPGRAAPAVPAAGDAGYRSYFKLSLAATGAGQVVTIADGATGSNSIAVVNGGSTYCLPPYTETVSGGALYLLKYTPAQFGSGGTVTSGATMVISSIHQSGGDFPTLPSGGTSGAYYYQLGRVISSGGALSAVQDHTAGVVQFQWYANCFLG